MNSFTVYKLLCSCSTCWCKRIIYSKVMIMILDQQPCYFLLRCISSAYMNSLQIGRVATMDQSHCMSWRKWPCSLSRTLSKRTWRQLNVWSKWLWIISREKIPPCRTKEARFGVLKRGVLALFTRKPGIRASGQTVAFPRCSGSAQKGRAEPMTDEQGETCCYR